jgi:hypothetical protein
MRRRRTCNVEDAAAAVDALDLAEEGEGGADGGFDASGAAEDAEPGRRREVLDCRPQLMEPVGRG